MSNHYNAIVLGLGAMGAAIACQLPRKARRGKQRFLGIDRFSPPHIYGSTHGDSRITRLAIGEGEEFSPLAIRSHELWREYEGLTKRQLLTTNGGLVISSSDKTSSLHGSNFFQNTVSAARRYNIRHEILDAQAIRKRFPQFNVDDAEVGYFEYSAGFLRPEECIKSELELAKRGGVELHTNERVLSFEPKGQLVAVNTDSASYTTEKLIVTAGPWIKKFIEEKYRRFFAIRRQVMFWFDVEKSIVAFLPGKFPIFIWEPRTTKYGIYGFPAIDGPLGGVKIASEQHEAETDPDVVDRTIHQPEVDAMYDTYVAPHLKGLRNQCVKAVSCLYTVTPDFGFVIDEYPDFENILVVSPCSGHGFKHSAAIGDVVSDLITTGESKIDISNFSLGRFLR